MKTRKTFLPISSLSPSGPFRHHLTLRQAKLSLKYNEVHKIVYIYIFFYLNGKLAYKN